MLMPLVEELYHADGQVREEVFETGSFMQSRMHQQHVSCSNCHEPHAGRLRAEGNALCLQCHEPQRFQARAHLMHEPTSTGAQCVNCHMPAETFMGIDVRHDHSFRVPDPAASVAHGVPNACTGCHEGRDDRWAAAAVAAREDYSGSRYAHTALLAGARRHDPAVAPGLLAYAADDARPAMLRAIALQESARFPSAQQTEAARAGLTSPDPLLRVAAVEALAAVGPELRLTLLRAAIEDRAKSVRMAAARQLAVVPLGAAPPDVRPGLGKLFDEYRVALQHNADMPESMSELAVFLMNQQDPAGAEAALLHARKLAPRFLPALLNLADLHRARGRDDLGEPLLEEAIRAWPESGDARHMLGLLYVRTGRTAESVAHLRRAVELAPGNPRYALVHAVALVETGQRTAGIAALEAAVRRFPADAELQSALAGFRQR